MIDFMTPTEKKRYRQLDKALAICHAAYDGVGRKNYSAVTRKLKKLRDYLNKEFPIKMPGTAMTTKNGETR